jgi:hypothetical protein
LVGSDGRIGIVASIGVEEEAKVGVDGVAGRKLVLRSGADGSLGKMVVQRVEQRWADRSSGPASRLPFACGGA